MHRLIEYLKKHTLFADGAMGTYYGEKYQEDGFLVERRTYFSRSASKKFTWNICKVGQDCLEQIHLQSIPDFSQPERK